MDEVGVVDEVDVPGKSAVVEDVAVMTGPLGEEGERVLARHGKAAEDAATLGAGGKTEGRHGIWLDAELNSQSRLHDSQFDG